MIVQQLFKTFKEDFPLCVFDRSNKSRQVWSENITLDNLPILLKNLILEISELSTIPKFSYLSRHIPDKIFDPLVFLKNKYKNFLIQRNLNLDFGIPTVWFVVYSESFKQIEYIGNRLEGKNIKFHKDEPNKYDSFDTIPTDNYSKTRYEATIFPKFLHQVTQIGIDLLYIPDSVDILYELNFLENMQGHIEIISSGIQKLERHLNEYSKFFRENIVKDEKEKIEFWNNFKRVYGIHSWPHFLFNICGVQG